MRRPFQIEVRDTVLDPIGGPAAKRTVYWRKTENGRWLYKVWLLLGGPDLPRVKSVTYQLHETFPNPKRTVRRTATNPQCHLVIWTWGLFDVVATIRDRDGTVYEVTHTLSYDDELAAHDNLEYKAVAPNQPRIRTVSKKRRY